MSRSNLSKRVIAVALILGSSLLIYYIGRGNGSFIPAAIRKQAKYMVGAQKIEPPPNQYRYDALNWLAYNPESQNRDRFEDRDILPTFDVKEIQARYSPLQMGGPSKKHDKWIVLTTIQPPTEDVKFLASLPGWRVVVVGDTKTPPDWRWENCDYINVDFQEKMGLQVVGMLQYKSYARKNTGYLYAIYHGAKWIYETDDDNRPTDQLKNFQYTNTVPGLMFAGKRLFNAYQYFGQSTLWQRGYPLGKVGAKVNNSFRVSANWTTPMVQQGVVNGDPDMDAVFRLTRKMTDDRLEVTFDPAGPPVILPPGVISPYNTQNTLIHYSALWSLFIPVSLNFRTCDIWRGYLAQRMLWEIGGFVGFYRPNAYQQRNFHDLMTDMADESQMYFTTEELIDALNSWTCPDELSFFQCYYKLMSDLVDKGTVILAEKDLIGLRKWIEDIIMLGYKEPKRIKFKPQKDREGDVTQNLRKKILGKGTPVYFASAEQREPTISWQPSVEPSPGWKYSNAISSLCPKTKSYSSSFIAIKDKAYDYFKDVLLIIVFNSPTYSNLKNLEVYYRSVFPNIAYCGRDVASFMKQSENDKIKNKLTFIDVERSFSAEHICTTKAIQMNYLVSGYLTIKGDTLLRMKPITGYKKDVAWISTSNKAVPVSVINGANGKPAYNKFITSDVKNTPVKVVSFPTFTGRQETLSSPTSSSRSYYYIPSRLQNSAVHYFSALDRHSVASEIAVPVVLRGIEKSENLGSYPEQELSYASETAYDVNAVCLHLADRA